MCVTLENLRSPRQGVHCGKRSVLEELSVHLPERQDQETEWFK